MEDIADTAYQDEQAGRLEDEGNALELAMLSVIAARLAKLTAETDYIQAREDVIRDMEKIEDLAARGSSRLSRVASSIIQKMFELNNEWAAAFYAAAEKVQDVESVAPIAKAGKVAARANVSAMCRTSVMGVIQPDGTFGLLQDAYLAAVNQAITEMRAGAPNAQSIRKAVSSLASGGLRVQYGSGRTRELYSAVATNVMDGYRDVMQALRDVQAEEFGYDGIEVSAHSMCAPDHQPYQGKRYTVEEFNRIQAGLRRPIGTGANCRHTTFKVLLSATKNAYTADERKRMRDDSNREVTYTTASGSEKTVTAYEFTQIQRQMELKARKLDARAKLMQTAGLDEDAKQARAMRRRAMKHYKRASEQAGVRTRLERTTIGGLQ